MCSENKDAPNDCDIGTVLRRSLEISSPRICDALEEEHAVSATWAAAAQNVRVAVAPGSSRMSSSPDQSSHAMGGRWAIRRSLDLIAANIRDESSRDLHSAKQEEQSKLPVRRSLDHLVNHFTMSLQDEEVSTDAASAPDATEHIGRQRLRVRNSLSHISSQIEDIIAENVSDLALEDAAASAEKGCGCFSNESPLSNVEAGTGQRWSANACLTAASETACGVRLGEDIALSGTGHFISLINDDCSSAASQGSVSTAESARSLPPQNGASATNWVSGKDPNLSPERQGGNRRGRLRLRRSLDLISKVLEQESLAKEASLQVEGEATSEAEAEDKFSSTRRNLKRVASGNDLDFIRREIKAAGGVTSHMALEILCAIAKEDEIRSDEEGR